ncbi:MAG: hypothetical protein JWM53_4926, partial [bacterium]|nr:hypothetical protein [bacterium]
SATERSVRAVATRLQLVAADSAGRLRLNARVDGDVTVRHDKPSGSLRLSDGHARWASERIDDIAVDAAFAGDQLIVRKADAVYRRGRVSANGHVALAGLAPRALDLALRTHELPLSRATLGLWLDSEASLHLVRGGGGLTGTLVVQRADAHVVRAGAGRTLQPVGPLADVTTVDRRAAAAPPPLTLPRLGLPLHLAVEVPGPVHIAGEEIDVHARGSLVVDTGGAHATARGRAEALPGGRLTLFDRRYDIERAALAFDGRAVDVDLAVTREVGDVALTLELAGPLDDPRVRLVSDPPVYDERQIGGLVAAGDARTEGVSSGQIGGRMVGVITGLIAGRVRDKVAPSLPLDVVKVEPGATAATPSRLEIGKFILGDRLYVSYAYQFGGLTLPTRRLNAHQAQIQLKLVRRLSLDARYGDAGAGALDLTFTLRR